jgi:hypothetical protein
MQQHVQPALRLAAGAEVAGDPVIALCQAAGLLQQCRKARLIQIGEAPSSVLTLAFAVFAGGVEDTARPQGVTEPSHDAEKFGGRHMEQACAGPDAIELVVLVDVLEAQALHRLPKVARGERDEARRGIEGGYAKAEPYEAQRIPTGPAAGVEDCRLIRQHRQEATVERRHVDSERLVKEGIGVLFVIVVRS